MALYYLETSALVKLYVRESGTARMLELATADADDRFVILSLAQVEVQSAVRRRQRAGDLSASVADKLLAMFQDHLEVGFEQQHVGDVEVQSACALVDQYALTTMDAIHMAAFVSLSMEVRPGGAIFVSADRELLRAVEAQQLVTIDASADIYPS